MNDREVRALVDALEGFADELVRTSQDGTYPADVRASASSKAAGVRTAANMVRRYALGVSGE